MRVLKDFLKKQYWSVLRMVKAPYWFFLNLCYKANLFKISDIPIIINNFNRLAYPLKLIEFLEKCGYTNIVILDNNSTYPPLLKFYESCRYKVIRENQNYGHLALWKSTLYSKYRWNYFVYTDADVLPVKECPDTFLNVFKKELDRNYMLDKIGFGLRIDDLPDSFSLKKQVIAYEQGYWSKEVRPGIFDAPIDTTFALYKPFSGTKNNEVYTLRAYRLGAPFLAHHLPWYVDSSDLSEEESYYIKTANASSSIGSGLVYK
jgi:hypothetical protein